MAKQRLDQLLVDRGLAPSRTKAQALIMAGDVFVAGQRADKPGTQIGEDADVSLKDTGPQWVSRGAFKLLHGIDHFALDCSDKIAIDVGASTGGFTEVLLKHGAARVYAVDVGHGQLDWKLRQDDRVVVLERLNARYLSTDHVPEPVELVVCDASFISLTKVLPPALDRVRPGGRLCALIKPQFEAGRDQVGRGGVVRDEAVHQEVCQRIAAWLDAQPGWSSEGITPSPILGPKGNREFLIAGLRSQS